MKVRVRCPSWMEHVITEEQKERLGKGEAIELRGKIYMVCAECLRVIRIDGLLGDIHYCN